MKHTLLVSTALATVIALSLVGGVNAQTTNATGTGTSDSTSVSGSQSGAVGVVGPRSNNASSNTVNNAGNSNARANSNSNATTNSASGSSSRSQGNASNQAITFNSPGQTTSANTNANTNRSTDAVSYSGGTSNSTWNGGDQTIRTTPTVYAPPVSGGNPCTLAVSGGVSVIGWGAAAGGTFVDQDCANRQKIAMMHNAGYAQAAKELMCNDRDSYFAFRTAGQPCAYRASFEGNMAPPASAQPLPVSAPVQQPTPVGPPVRTTSTQAPFQPAGRFACLDARGREVAAGTPGASCGQI